MSLFRYNPRDYFYTSPMERFIASFFDGSFDEKSYRPLQSIAPYWLNQPILSECNIGNAVGEVVDNNDKFAVQVDVSHFHPKELSVSVRDRELSIEGHHKERTDQSGHGSIERHFIRKYVLPEEVQTETIESHLSDKGVLTISATKKATGLPEVRNIPIVGSPRAPEPADKPASDDPEK